MARETSHFISGDWGTTSLRLYLCTSAGEIVERIETGDGILSVEQGAFEGMLLNLTETWRQRDDLSDAALSVVLSGMIGSRQGWHEVAYAACPTDLEAIASQCETVEIGDKDANLGTVRIIPGLTTTSSTGLPDVMRGEETQIFGALIRSPDLAARQTFLLPGTHAKWAYVSDGRITSFRTYMTGEVFAALMDQTILGRPAASADTPPETEAKTAFLEGVEIGAAEGQAGALLNRAFSTRTRFLFDSLGAGVISDYLSGLLIGAEIADATAYRVSDSAGPINIIANASLTDRYETALAYLGHKSRRTDPDCVVHAHARICAI